MDINQFLKTTGAGGEALARQAWAKAAELAKAAAPEAAAKIDAALAPDPEPEPEPDPEPEVVAVSASDSGNASEGRA